MSASDIELAVTTARHLESLLDTHFGAVGRGLHEKLTSVEAALPPEALGDGRYVATMRNKVVHEDSFALPDRDRFLRCAQAFEKAIGGRAKKGRKVPWGLLIFLIGVAIWVEAATLRRWVGPEVAGTLRLAAVLVTAILPIIWLRRFFRGRKRGVVVFLLVFGLLWILVATMAIDFLHR